MKIKSTILLSLFSLTLHAANPQLPVNITKSIAIPRDLNTHHTFTVESSNPGPLTFEIKTTHTVIVESPTFDRATNVFEKASNAYFNTQSPLATLGMIVIGCAALYVGYKLSQIEKPQTFQKILAVAFMTGGFIAACAPFVLRTISV